MAGKVERTVDSGYSWLVLLATFVAFTLFTLNFTSYGIFLPEFIDYFRVTKASATMPGSLSVGIGGLIGIVLGPMVKKFGTRIVVMTGGTLAGLGIFAAGFSPNIMFVNILYGVFPGVGIGTFGIGATVALLEYFEKRRSLAVGVAMTGLSLGTFISPQMSQFLIDTYGWRGAMIILGGIQLNGALVGALLKPQGTAEEQSTSAIRKKDDQRTGPRDWITKLFGIFDLTLLKDMKITLYLISDSLVIAAHIIPFILLPARAIAAGSDKFKAASVMTIFGICGGSLRPVVGFFGDKMDIQRTLAHGATSIFAGALSLIFFFFEEYVFFAVYAGLFGATSAGYVSLEMAIIGDLIPPDKLATGTGIFMFCIGLTTLMAPPLAGWIVDVTGSYAIPFLVYGGVQILGGCCSIWTYILQRRQKEALKTPPMVELTAASVTKG